MSDETLIGPRRLKEKARSCRSAHNVVIVAKDTCAAVDRAHCWLKKYEGEAKRKQELKEEEELNKKKQEVSLNKLEKKWSKLCIKQKILHDTVAKTSEEMTVEKKMLGDINNNLEQAISEGNMMKIKRKGNHGCDQQKNIHHF